MYNVINIMVVLIIFLVILQTNINVIMLSIGGQGTELSSETLYPFVDSSVDKVLLQTNPDFTSRFLNSSIFLNVRPI